MKTMTATILAILFTQAASATVPVVIEPSEDYKFDCEIQISEQVGANRVAATTSVTADKSQFHRGNYTYVTTSEGWTPIYDSKELPKRLAGHQLMFEFGEDYEQTRDKVYLYGRIRAGQISSMSKAKARFSTKEGFDFYGNLSDEKSSLTLKVKCSR